MKGLMTWERMPVNDILNPVAALCLPAVICQGSTRLQPVPPTPTGFRPPTPSPHPKPLGVIALLKALRRNPIECWTKAHFEQPIVLGGFPFGRVALVSDPAAIRKVLVENPHDYRKSALERRVLSARLREGLVAVEGQQWESQRRTLAPLFTRKMVLQFAPAMANAAAALVERWRNRPNGAAVDLKTEMSGLALDGLVRSVFQEGLGADPEAMRAAMVAFFTKTGRIDPFDLIGVPDFVPRVTQLRVRAFLRAFYRELDSAIAARRRKLDEYRSEKPRDLLGIMLAATDPQTGASMSEAEVKGNVLTSVSPGRRPPPPPSPGQFTFFPSRPSGPRALRAKANASSRVQATGLPSVLSRPALFSMKRCDSIHRLSASPEQRRGRISLRGTPLSAAPWW